MSLLTPGLSARIKGFPNRKPPALLPFPPGLIAPEWGWFWKKAVFVVPLWEGGGRPRDIAINPRAQQLVGTLSGNAMWEGRSGIGFAAGADDRVDFGTVNMIGPGANNKLTVEVLTSVNGTSVDQALFSNGPVTNLAGDSNWFLWWDKAAAISSRTDTVSFGVVDASDDLLSRVEGSNNLLTAGEVTHIVAQFQQTPETLKLYINGVLDQEDTDLNGVNPDNIEIEPLQLGAAGSAKELDGSIGLAVVYWDFLTPREILKRARDPFGPFHTRSLPLFIPSAIDTFDTALLGSSSPRWDRKVRVY